MTSNFEHFKQQLDDAVQLLENSDIVEKNAIALPNSLGQLVDTQSLLARCDSLCQNYENTKPTIRIIHHLACSGGTLISKCISAMPNTFLLSEVHPYTNLHMSGGKPKFLPSDINTLSKYAGVFNQNILADELFISQVSLVHKHISKHGGFIVLRDHSHSDFCVGDKSDVCTKSSVVEVLKKNFNIKSVVTLRDPVDSYLSLSNNNWLHFSPETFNEYCARVLAMLEALSGVPVILYEDFVSKPVEIMQEICQKIDISFDESFIDIFDVASVSGESGRGGSIIESRERRPITEELQQEFSSSANYRLLSEKFNFVNEKV